MSGGYGRRVTDTPATGGLWPPRSDTVPEPLLSTLHAVVLGRLPAHLGVQVGRRNPSLVEVLGSDWASVRRAVLAFVHDEGGLQERVQAHLDAIAAAVGGAVPMGSPLAHDDPIGVVRHHLVALLYGDPDLHEPTTTSDRRSAEYWTEWLQLNPLPAEVSSTATAGIPLGYHLGMATPDIVEHLLTAARPAALEAYTQEGTRRLTGGLRLDELRLADATGPYDVEVASILLERALVKTHLIGALGRDDLRAMGVDPAAHPCGIDVFGSADPAELVHYAWAMTGLLTDSAPMILEWGRHEHLDFGEDEDLMFAEWDVPAMLAAADDPLCVKSDWLRLKAAELLARRRRLS